jgi:hypothetical protein
MEIDGTEGEHSLPGQRVDDTRCFDFDPSVGGGLRMSECIRERCNDGDFNFIPDVGNGRESVEAPAEDDRVCDAFRVAGRKVD